MHRLLALLFAIMSAASTAQAQLEEFWLQKSRHVVQQDHQTTPVSFGFHSYYAGSASVNPELQFPTGQSLAYSMALGDLSLGPFADEAALEAAAPPGEYLVRSGSATANSQVAFGTPWPDPLTVQNPTALVFDPNLPRLMTLFFDRPTVGSWNTLGRFTDMQTGERFLVNVYEFNGIVYSEFSTGRFLPNRTYALTTWTGTGELASIFMGGPPFEQTAFYAERITLSTIHFTTIPAPGAASLFAFGGLLAAHRRRVASRATR